MNFSKSELQDKSNNLYKEGTYQDTTLRICSIKHLALTLGFSQKDLFEVANDPSKYYREFTLDVKGKNRTLVESTGKLKILQRRLLRSLLQRLQPFKSSFGSIKGKSIKDNAEIHAKSSFYAVLDIKDFYPSIHNKKVYEFFSSTQKCSPDVARILTKLTTRNHSLPLGFSTSPMLADQIVRKIDSRIDGIAKKHGLKYSRYVDDITLSGNFPLERISGLISKILKQSGFQVKKEKVKFYTPYDDEKKVTGVAIRKGQISAPLEYTTVLENELNDAIKQSNKSKLTREFQTREHYFGCINYVRWLDEQEGNKLLRLYRKIKWKHLKWMLQNGMIIQA